jgi:radical SAM superfamily enzyme YgiQ (UPF0313 family)
MVRVLLGSISITYDLWLPYSVGCLMSYAIADKDLSNVQFAEPLYKWLPDDEIKVKLQQIDLLGLTCYTWNHEYNYHIASVFKEINPNGIVIFGGPNIPVNQDLHQDFAFRYPVVDCFFIGQGEKAFVDILKHVNDPVETWHSCFGFGFSNTGNKSQNITPEFMPQPYLDGIFDSILAKEPRIKASFETNRGCPFKCAFCDWGGTANGKVIKFPEEQIYDTIDFIYSHRSITEVEILDANFGMNKRDLDTVKRMVVAKNKHNNNPTVSYSGLVKNGSQYLVEIIDIIHNQLGAETRHLKLSFQTHSKTTLDTVLRDNIKNEKLLALITELNCLRIPVSSEMIIGLPGETASSWLESQSIDYIHGIAFMRTYILSLVCNTKLYEKEYRSIYGIKTKRILVPYEMKDIHKNVMIQDPTYKVIDASGYEVGEIIHQCHSFDLNEMVLMFRYFWWYHNLYNSGAFKKTIKHLYNNGIDIENQTKSFFAMVHYSPLFTKIIQKHDAIVSKIYADEPETILDDYQSYRFYSGSLRTDDLFVMLQNRKIVVQQMSEILRNAYPQIAEIDTMINQDVSGWSHTDSNVRLVSKLFGMGSTVL